MILAPVPELVVAATPFAPSAPWLMDTGSGVDLISRATIAALTQHITKSSEPLALTTANGDIDATDEITLFVNCIKMMIQLHVLPNTPNVLSVGRRVVEEGFGFYWDPYSLEPYMTAPSTGGRIPMYVEQNCPCLCDNVAAGSLQLARCPTTNTFTHAAVSTPVVKAEGDAAPLAPPPAPPVDVDPGDRRDLKAEALSTAHIPRHMPFNKWRPMCVRAKMLRRPARRAVHPEEDAPKKFGDLVNADHIIANSDEAMGLTGERNALAVVDRYSDYKDCFPLDTKDADDTLAAHARSTCGQILPRSLLT